MIPESELRDYFKRSGDNELLEGVTIYKADKGFCVYGIDEEHLILMHVYGDGKYWDKWAEDKAKELGLDRILFATKRNPDGFCRKYKYDIIGYVLERKI